MTTSLSELRRTVEYEALKAVAFTPSDPDAISFEIGTDEHQELVEVECLSSGLKTVFYWNGPGQRVEVELESEEFNSWSVGLRRKIGELLIELASWEAKLRQPGGPWDAALLANPNCPSP